MHRTGSMELALHPGSAPHWLIRRMKGLAEIIITMMVEEFGVEQVLRRLSDPLWFQALSCVLAFDWDSSGTTTVTCGVLKDILAKTDLGLRAVGGKGEKSRRTQGELEALEGVWNLSTQKIEGFKYSSRMTAKVDGAAIQAGYQLYHHTLFLTEKGEWAVVQQGLNPNNRTARRYHWLSSSLKSYVEEPHTAILGQMKHPAVLDLTSRKSRETREACVDIVKEGPRRVRRLYLSVRVEEQTPLSEWLGIETPPTPAAHYKLLPKRMDWDAVAKAYEADPRSFEELLALRGIGPATVRGLALVSQLVYGTEASWEDPVKFTFAFGGKDGVPFPVNRGAMDRAILFLEEAVKGARMSDRVKLGALARLKSFAISLERYR